MIRGSLLGPWRIARILGIDIALDWSWFIILILLVYSLGFVQFPYQLHPRTLFARPDVLSIGLGLVTALLLFGSVLAHELSHSWMALARGIPVNSITLFIFGGVAQIAREPDRASTEFLIAIMGPLMSLTLAILFGAAWLWLHLVQGFPLTTVATHGLNLRPLILLTGIIAEANGALAVFNLAPGFPLDGGRILRAVLWGVLRDLRRATRLATLSGQLIAALLVALGGWLFLNDADFAGIWYILIGFFLWNAARDSYRQMLLRLALARQAAALEAGTPTSF